MNIANLRQVYGNNFEGLHKEDKALIASIILYYTSLGKDKPEYLNTVLGVCIAMGRFIYTEPDEVSEFVLLINEGFSDPELLDISRALLASF